MMRLLIAVSIVCLLVVPVHAKYSGGSGTARAPYQIATATDLIALGETPDDYDKHFVLTADIDLDPALPGRKVFDKGVIAAVVDYHELDRLYLMGFCGRLDGQGHRILNLMIQGTSHLGLFGVIGFGGMVCNLGVVDVDSRATTHSVGALTAHNYGTIANCYSTGIVSSTGGDAGYDEGENIGGLVGWNASGVVFNCWSNCRVSGSYDVGGLVGDNGGTVSHSFATGSVSAKWRVGGLVGDNESGGVVNCYSTGKVTSHEQGGGLVGSNGHEDWKGLVIVSFWDVETSGQETSAGGMGLTTAKMQDITTFLNAGWDFVDEVANGTCDYWQMLPGEYPQLHYEGGNRPLMPEGLGTTEEPYLIRDARDLGTMWFEPMAHYRLAQSIDLSGMKWSTAVIPWFGGTLDGNDHTISHLTIVGTSHLGLFGELGPESSVSNVGLRAVEVSGHYNVGGLVGLNLGSVVLSHSSGSVSGTAAIGGLVGGSWYYGSITNCHSGGLVKGEWDVGGLVGDNSGGIASSYSCGSVNGGEYVGGLVGFNSGSIAASHSNGMVSGDADRVGGLVGSNYGSITSSYSCSSVTGDTHLGGLVGNNGGGIASSFSSGLVNGNAKVGGLVGSNGTSIISSYSTSTVSGEEYAGGLVGFNEERGSIRSSFWDIQTSGQATSAGGTGLTTAQMQDIETFVGAGWDFVDEVRNGTCDYWQMLPGEYPQLHYQGGTRPLMPEGLGTAEQPYLLCSARDLGTIWFEPLAQYRLEESVDLSGVTWSMAVIPWFGGCFDGNSHVVRNVKIDGGSYLGLFGVLGYGASVCNLGLEEVEINGVGKYLGGLVGSNDGSISSSYSCGSVTGDTHVGGLVGSNGGAIASSFSSGAVRGEERVGGLVGFNWRGLVGTNMGSIANCYSTGSVNGSSGVGGLAGRSFGRIDASYSNSSISGDSHVGGLVGYNWSSIARSYSTGSVNGTSDVGGLVGKNGNTGQITTSFWDIQTSGQVTSDGGSGKTTAEMQTAATFLGVGWDFMGEAANGTEDIWRILEGQDYPRLWWELLEDGMTEFLVQ